MTDFAHLAEKVVYDYFNQSSKTKVCFRFHDSYDVIKLLKRKQVVPLSKNPSDLLIVDGGKTYFAEVKTTDNVRGLTRPLFEQQRVIRDRILLAGGLYYYFVYSSNIKQWYKIPGEVIKENPNVKWGELGKYMINYLGAIY